MVAHPRRLHIAVVVVSLLLPGISLSAAARQPGGPEPLCQVSTDPTYGRSVDNPITVGGNPVYGAARQRRYARVAVLSNSFSFTGAACEHLATCQTYSAAPSTEKRSGSAALPGRLSGGADRHG
jgi:hypothetical protein